MTDKGSKKWTALKEERDSLQEELNRVEKERVLLRAELASIQLQIFKTATDTNCSPWFQPPEKAGALVCLDHIAMGMLTLRAEFDEWVCLVRPLMEKCAEYDGMEATGDGAP